ncbi:MAG: hypothetical protein E6J71_07375 [Deltaproteobacteria bacterium]|nr:MAG: hypothetical protein E6J76_10810 [Deltaproteobacteria bacterium]TMA69468.1 MAG: hypothetical protein E6J77_28055 [Deltaproteobacteria bacterium]TMB21899.1 MAG: hypothetical protein E6J71_07375 [Deltaproteobacteria bacterium]
MRSFVLAGLLGALVATTAPAKEFVAQESDFRCLRDGSRVEGHTFLLFNKNHHRLRKAIHLAEKGQPGKHYPVGTIVQLFPFEAMVKRGGHFNPDGDGWEFFRLIVSASGTQIAARGGPEVANVIGSCQNCHSNVAPTYDLICEFVIGSSGLGLTDEQVRAAQNADLRCPPAP